MAVSPDKFTQESFLISEQNHEIKSFWLKGHFSSFKGMKGIRINYASFVDPKHTRNLVIVPGRVEGYLKYKELTFDFFNQGFNIFILDHRGQGISERLLHNSNKGYVESFEYYVEDLNTFISDVVNQSPLALTQGVKPYLLAHSMGGAISLRLMQRLPHLIQAAILSTPMVGIKLGGLPQWVASTLVFSGDIINQLVDDQSWYFISQGDYQVKPFRQNDLTHSKIRYQRFIEEYQSNKYIQLGGVTYHWLREAFSVKERIFHDVDKLSTPILILQSSKDSIVDNELQDLLCQQVNYHTPSLCEKSTIVGAKHELFFEIDLYREQALQKSLAWIDSH